MIELTRLKDWRARYEATIDAIKAEPFSWAAHDCAQHLAGRVVAAITGTDLVSQYAGRYQDEDGAIATMKAAGFDSLGAMVASLLPQIHVSQARIGDVAAIAVDQPFGHVLGVVNGERIFVLKPTGLGTVRLLSADMAFKVG